jgi:hypothetical protein
MRTGRNTHETVFDDCECEFDKIGKLGAFIVDGKADAQPLYLSNISIPGHAIRNVLYVAMLPSTAASLLSMLFDADSISGNTTNPPAQTYAARTATAQTSRGFLSPAKKDSFVQLPTRDSAVPRLAAMARIS